MAHYFKLYKEQYLSEINRNQPFCKRYTNWTSLGKIMESRDGYISCKIYSQTSLSYQKRYPISKKFNFWSVRIYCASFDWTEMDHTTTLEKKNWLGQIVTFRSYKTLIKMARQSTRYKECHFRQTVGSTNTETELHVFADALKIAHGVASYIRFKVNNQS